MISSLGTRPGEAKFSGENKEANVCADLLNLYQYNAHLPLFELNPPNAVPALGPPQMT